MPYTDSLKQIRAFLQEAHALEKEHDFEQAETDEFNHHVAHTYTVHEISAQTGVPVDRLHSELQRAVHELEDLVVWRNPEDPQQDRYALREHADALGLRGYAPGRGG